MNEKVKVYLWMNALLEPKLCRNKASRIILMMPRNFKDHSRWISRMKKARCQAKAKISR